MQQQARVIDVKRVHSCLDVVILNGRRMDRNYAIRLDCVVTDLIFSFFFFFSVCLFEGYARGVDFFFTWKDNVNCELSGHGIASFFFVYLV